MFFEKKMISIFLIMKNFNISTDDHEKKYSKSHEKNKKIWKKH